MSAWFLWVLITVSGLTRTCVSGGGSTTTTECWDGSQWEAIDSLALVDIVPGLRQTAAVNLGGVSCLVGGLDGSGTILNTVLCTNWSSTWLSMPVLPLAHYGGTTIYGKAWTGVVATDATSNSYFLNFSNPQASLNPHALTLPWVKQSMPAWGARFAVVIGPSNCSCLTAGAGATGTLCLNNSSGWIYGQTWTSPLGNLYKSTSFQFPGLWCVGGGINQVSGITTVNTTLCVNKTLDVRHGGAFTTAPWVLPLSVYFSTNVSFGGMPCFVGGYDAANNHISNTYCANMSAQGSVEWLPMPSLNYARGEHASWTLDDLTTLSPTLAPTLSPTISPTKSPTTLTPTLSPTLSPTFSPTLSPTTAPTSPPTSSPTSAPTRSPTTSPTTQMPTTSPTISPTRMPTTSPTVSPTRMPTTLVPTGSPTTSSPVTIGPTLSTTRSPIHSAAALGNQLGTGDLAGIVIGCLVLLALLLALLWWCTHRRKRGTSTSMMKKKPTTYLRKTQKRLQTGGHPIDPREVALDLTLDTCENILSDSTLSEQTQLLVQAVMVGADQDKLELTTLLGTGTEMTSVVTALDKPQSKDLTIYNIEDFERVKFLSRGEGGTAELYKHKETGTEVVIKVPHDVDELEAEARVWITIGNHPNIARLIGVADLDGRHHGIIMEYYSGGSLESQNHEISATELVRMTTDLARGLQHLHAHKVIHRDLAPRNILVASDRKVAITDFGMSRQLDENDNYQMNSDARLPWRTLAPELIAIEDGKRVFTEKTDIWALGVTLWELATHKNAYAEELEKDPIKMMKQKVGTGALTLDMKPIIMYHANIATAIIGCLQLNPAHRPSAEQLRWLLKDNGKVEVREYDGGLIALPNEEYAMVDAD